MKNKKFLIVFAVITVAVLVTGIYFLLNSGIVDKITGKKIFELKPVVPINEYAKTETITKDGGQIAVVDGKGVKITLIVPPNALEDDTEITFSPAEEVPIKDYNQEGIFAVFISPSNLKFNVPATVSFDFNNKDDADTAQVSNYSFYSTAQTATLSDEEKKRRESTEDVTINNNSGTIFTDSSEDQAGDTVFLSPSQKSENGSDINTQTNSGGSIAVDTEMTEPELIEHAENTIDNPNSTIEQIVEAWSVGQGLDANNLSKKAKKKLKERINEAINKIEKDCQEGKRTSGVTILKLQEISQSLGFEEEEEKLSDLSRGCKGRYSFSIQHIENSVPGCAECTVTYDINASVCGFVDDEWSGTEVLHLDITQGAYADLTANIKFSLPPGGGAGVLSSDAAATGCSAGHCETASVSGGGSIYYDGVDTVWFHTNRKLEGKIKYQKDCN